MARLVLGVIGHVDHGKTALVRALTGADTDRLPEEKRRGISIALGFAHVEASPGLTLDLIDMPGHERFVRTMIAGATGIDAVLLVVAANEGIKPQTREHIDIAALLGLRRAVIAVSKADLVSPEQAAAAAREAAALAAASGLQAGPPVLTSSVRGEGIAALLDALVAAAAARTAPDADGVAYLPIDRAFSVAGAGTVVTGTLRGAALAAGDALELWPPGRPVRVRGLQVHGARVAVAAPGQRVAVNLRDVEAVSVGRGATLAAPGLLPPSSWLTVALRAVADAPELRTTMRLQALVGTDEVAARLRLLDRDVLAPGETALAQLQCAAPVVVPAGEHLILRLASPARTVAGGRIVEAETRRLRRHAPEVLRRLAALAGEDRGEALRQALAEAGATGVSLQALSRATGLAPAKVAERLQRAPVVIGKGSVAVAEPALRALLARIPTVLAPHREGLARDRLLAALPGVGEPVLDEALARLLEAGTVRNRGGALLVPRPDEERARASAEAGLAERIAAALRQAGLSPPDPAVLAPGPLERRALERLLRDGVLVRAHDRVQKRDVLFHRDAVAEARRVLAPLLAAPPGLLVGEIGAALGISRKFSVPLLEHLDSVRFTRRVEDRRLLAATAPAL